MLNAMGNLLDSLPRDIGHLTSLRLIGLKSNRLTALPPSFRSENPLTHTSPLTQLYRLLSGQRRQ